MVGARSQRRQAPLRCCARVAAAAAAATAAAAAGCGRWQSEGQDEHLEELEGGSAHRVGFGRGEDASDGLPKLAKRLPRRCRLCARLRLAKEHSECRAEESRRGSEAALHDGRGVVGQMRDELWKQLGQQSHRRFACFLRQTHCRAPHVRVLR